MSAQNYQRTITVDASPVDVYRALTKKYDRWWTTTSDKVFNMVGDQIKFTFPPLVSYWTFEAKNLEPNHLVELECIDAYHEMSALPDAPKQEWLGSHLRWRIQSDGNHTNVDFTHDGLTPGLHYYDECEAGWD